MHLVEAILFLVSLVIVSNVLSHYIVSIPVSLIQTALGVGVALIFHLQINLATDWFMLLFIAPLLFNDGRHFPKRELWKLRGPIIGNAIFLVFATILIGGLFMHWLVPAMPLSAGFALAAIIAPTDPIAVQSLAKRVHLPDEVLHLVSGESLINDASGLIGFKYGIAATVTGAFALGDAIGDFFYIAIVGAIAGAVLMIAINFARQWLLQQGINDVILHTILQIMTPFLIYLLVDEGLNASGVIAVVVAGLLNNSQRNRYIAALPELRIVTERTWDIVVYVLNGIIFLILGIELPLATGAIIRTQAVNTWQAFGYALAVYIVVLTLRVAWGYAYMWWQWMRKNTQKRPAIRTALLTGISGVRGAITLVGVLAVPALLDSGDAFPERDLMLFIAAIVVVLSLVVAVVSLPLITKIWSPLQLRGSAIEQSALNDEDTDDDQADVRLLTEDQAKIFVYQTAVRRLESERRETNQKPVLDLMGEYQALIRRIELDRDTSDTIPPLIQDELVLRRVGIRGELIALDGLKKDGQIDAVRYKKTLRALERRLKELNILEDHYGQPTLHLMANRLQLQTRHLATELFKGRTQSRYQDRLFVEKELAKSGLKAISAFLKKPENRAHQYNRQVIYSLIVQYRNRIASVKDLSQHKSQQYEREVQRLRAIAFAAERTAIHDLAEQGYLTPRMAQKLNQGVNFTENAAELTEG
ncbi:cation:proton antiporter [Lacticaseibacillus saniviri]|uniref:NhaP-type Na+ H+ and K+ H+ antiporter n=1 Tax=Lacticaseibacillus saniviri JCM 17471 = DSM 24301 TaxID=1293598 RepID=A0A0R2MSN5_9LACO|nr:sodium:proton antiporter [Lacticaseibacillus saniviri]KRO16582.1 NhaP-type Na+ H+ and K+ H+ antiporter [Lacticaseibacillus saniviri JCM 17471 = DSM 24301]MCG4282713.1 sodium:proton antiporter [Lacticaseibacillus saniviri]